MMHGQKNIKLSQQIAEKYSNINYHETSCTGSRVVSCGRTDGQRDMTKLIVTFQKSLHCAVRPECSNTIPINFSP
jgi:hypothetical protein